jgi:hypothetical protein
MEESNNETAETLSASLEQIIGGYFFLERVFIVEKRFLALALAACKSTMKCSKILLTQKGG